MELNLERNLGKYFNKTMYHSHAPKLNSAGLLLAHSGELEIYYDLLLNTCIS